jgi:Tol biopolymer transport system component
MGEVYRAKDTKLGREVAIKTLPATLAADKDRLARFEREAKLLASLNHAHIASVHNLDEHDGTLYIAMELVEGETLEQKLKTGALPLEDTLRIALQIAEALEAAHEKGVVHRDLKPANVMVRANGDVKVLDFGLAKAFSGDPNQATLAHSPALSVAMTQQGLILGTAGYMSPEQASGQATDQRADIWAFGVVLYEMLTGLPLFSGESVPHVLADVLKTQPDWRRLPKNLHPRLRQMLERCLEKKVRNRYHSMADVRVDIERVLSDPRGGAVVASEARPFWRRAVPVSAAALLLGAVLTSIYFIALRQPAVPPEAAAPLPVSRFVITPPATAPLASQNPGDVAISRDGKRIAYVAQNLERNTVELHVRELDALESRPLPGTETDAAMMPFFSGDGRSIGFFAGQRGVLSVAVDGRPSIKLLDAPETGFVGASWEANNTLIYSSWRRLHQSTASGGGTPVPLTAERQGADFVAAPALLPGGRAALFVDIEGATEYVAVLDLETGEEKRLLEGGTVVYSETGHIVFGRGTTLMAAPFNVAELAVTGEPVAVLQGVRHPGPGTATDFDLAANGTLVYVPVPGDAVESESAVVWVDRTGNAVGRAVSELVNGPVDPTLSPDETRLLLVAGGRGEGAVWSYDLRGRPPIPLALAGNNRFPVWSPDSRQVAFARVEGASTTIFILPADGSVLAPEPWGATGLLGIPKTWSAADELILLEVRGGSNLNITARPIRAPDDVREIVATDFAEVDASLSPNGGWLAFVSNRTGRDEIWVQGYPDGVAVRVSTNGGIEPKWSADGRELYYLQGNAMMAVAVESEGEFSFEAPEQLFAGSYLTISGPFGSSYDVARDGRFLMIEPPGTSTAAAPASIVVVENWAEELKRLVPAE